MIIYQKTSSANDQTVQGHFFSVQFIKQYPTVAIFAAPVTNFSCVNTDVTLTFMATLSRQQFISLSDGSSCLSCCKYTHHLDTRRNLSTSGTSSSFISASMSSVPSDVLTDSSLGCGRSIISASLNELAMPPVS